MNATTTILLFSLSACFLPSLSAQNDGDRLFDPSYVHEIRFETAQDGFYPLLVSTWFTYYNEGVPYLPGNVRIDGQLVDSVGVRVKGGVSAFDDKKPLKIDFNQYISGQSFDGLKKLNLHNGNYDPAFMRDHLGYYIFRQAGVKSPRSAFARVFFNDTYNGLYVMVEEVDKNFLRNNFASDEGTLYKNINTPTIVVSGDSTMAYFNEMNNISNTLTGPAFEAALGQVLDTEVCLRYFLVENFINAKDNSIDLNVNYYLYHQPESGLLYWIPWDLNYALNNGTAYPLLYLTSPNVLYKKMLQTPAYRQRYLELACEMLDYLFDDTQLKALIEQNAQMIRGSLENDPLYAYSLVGFDADVEKIKMLMTTRRQTFLNDLSTASFVCPSFGSPVAAKGLVINEFVASSDSLSGIPDASGGYPDWIELYNNTNAAVSLKGFYLSNDVDFPKHWPLPQNAFIEPGGYMIVWADRDVTEPGLHADFKLDKSGGQLVLTFEDLTIIDSVSYSAQTTNAAFARVPNGTGSFTMQQATFAENNAVSAIKQPEQSLEIIVYPNPGVQTIRMELTTPDLNVPVQIRLSNALGEVVVHQEFLGSIVNLDVHDLPAGIYFLFGMQGHKRFIRQVIIGKH